MKQEIKTLIEHYQAGKLTGTEERKIEEYIASGELELSDFEDLNRLKASFDNMVAPEPSQDMTSGFYAHLQQEEQKSASRFNLSRWFSSLWSHQPAVRWAYSIVLIAAGILGGFYINGSRESDSDQIESLASEVLEMKEMMMLTLLEKESTSDRLKAVSLTNEMSDASTTVIDALIQTLNSDENVNVRLSALEALYPYTESASVRSKLVQSIAHQDSPLVQVALAEMMVNLQEKKSVDELKKILKKEDTPYEIKERVKESIDVLI